MGKTTFNQRVYEIIHMIPRGKVLSYGHIAQLLGAARASRQVGYAVAARKAPLDLPYHRVVYQDGRLSPVWVVQGKNRQYDLLKAEGITFTADQRVNMLRHEWSGAGASVHIFNKFGL